MAYSKGLYQSSGKEKESCCLEFPSSTKREIRHFHVVAVQLRAKKCKKKRAKLLFCYYKPVAFFCRSSCRRGRLCLSSLVQPEADGALISTPSTPSLDQCSVLWVFKATTPNKGNGVIHSLARLATKI